MLYTILDCKTRHMLIRLIFVAKVILPLELLGSWQNNALCYYSKLLEHIGLLELLPVAVAGVKSSFLARSSCIS